MIDITGFPQALENMENLENHKKKNPCMEKIIEFEETSSSQKTSEQEKESSIFFLIFFENLTYAVPT